MDELILPGFHSEQESLRALSDTSPQLALLALMRQASHDDFVCIGRDEDGHPTAVIVDREAFLEWLAAPRTDQRLS